MSVSELPHGIETYPSGSPPGTKSIPTKSKLPTLLLNILAFLGQRLVFSVLVLLFIIYLSYFGLDLAGGVEIHEAAGNALQSSADYLTRLMQGDLGVTTAGSETLIPRPTGEVLVERLPRSLGLLGASLLTASVIGVLLGFMAAWGRSERSLGILVATLIGISVPSFLAAFILQWLVIKLTQYAGRSFLPVGGFGWDSHLILPMLVLAARPIAQITRITFVAIRKVLDEDYVRTAYSKGLHEYSIIFTHVLRNAAIPILTTIGVSLRFSLSSLPVVELYFGWPGAGFTLLKAISQRDDNLTIALVVSLGLLFILINLLLEVAYRLIDPRIATANGTVPGVQKGNPLELLRQIGNGLKEMLVNNRLVQRLTRRDHLADTQPVLIRRAPDDKLSRQLDNETPTERHANWVAALKNVPFMVGSLLVLVFIAVMFIGPQLSPNNPYTTLGLVTIDGQLTPPPFAPNDTFPLGTDALGRGILSLLLSGAQQTLMLAMLVVAARAVVGVILGAIAGWANGTFLDRFIIGMGELIAAFPTLLAAMILILAFGIRKGMFTFVIALCFVGWAEIMQFVRSEVISIKPQLFIESAMAIGARIPRILLRHVLPNLFSALISIVALEMGAVLMLLGELGFIGIFIGGGSFIELPTMSMLYSDVPEWGALLSNVRTLVRSYPWTGFYPMMAFFLAILGFNLFGEGMRRLVEEGNLITNRLFNRYTLIVAVVAVAGFNWLGSNNGAIPFYTSRSKTFDGERAYQTTNFLSNDRLYGRALGTPGTDLTAIYIAQEFERLGLQPGGRNSSYFQERKHAFERITGMPVLTLKDGGSQPVFGEDYAIYPGRSASFGEASGKIRVVLLGDRLTGTRGFRTAFPDLYNEDLSDEIILVISDADAAVISGELKQGMLVVAPNKEALGKNYTYSARDFGSLSIMGLRQGGATPSLWISEEITTRLLAGSGVSLDDLRARRQVLPQEGVEFIALDTSVDMHVDGEVEERFPVKHVIGYLPGTSGGQSCTTCLGDRLIVVLAQYDAPPPLPNGVAYPSSNNDASGVATMLEAIRVIQESDYQPYKSFLFIAYSGEGQDGGEFVNEPDVQRFLQARTGFTNFNLEAIVRLRGVGAGDGNRLVVTAGGSLRLADLFEEAARRVGAPTTRAGENIDISVIYGNQSSFLAGGQEAPEMYLYWEGWQRLSRTGQDTMQNISAQNLEDTGETLTLALMILGRETQY